jgi:hypothetical protein
MDITTTTETDNRPNVGQRVVPAGSSGRVHGEVVRRPAGVTYVVVLWDSTGLQPAWEQQVSYADVHLAVCTYEVTRHCDDTWTVWERPTNRIVVKLETELAARLTADAMTEVGR